jgi:hypothetical protein
MESPDKGLMIVLIGAFVVLSLIIIGESIVRYKKAMPESSSKVVIAVQGFECPNCKLRYKLESVLTESTLTAQSESEKK